MSYQTFHDKREKTRKEARRKIIMYCIIGIMVVGSLLALIVPIVQNRRLAKETPVESTVIGEDDDDLAAKDILEGDPIKIKREKEADDLVKKDDAEKAIKEAVDKANEDFKKQQEERDQKQEEELKKREEDIKKQVDELTSTNKTLTDQNDTLTRRTQSLQNDLNVARQERDNLRTERDQERQRANELETRLRDVLDELAEARRGGSQ